MEARRSGKLFNTSSARWSGLTWQLSTFMIPYLHKLAIPTFNNLFIDFPGQRKVLLIFREDRESNEFSGSSDF